MSGPRIDPRRQPELFAELRARADATVSGRSVVEGIRISSARCCRSPRA